MNKPPQLCSSTSPPHCREVFLLEFSSNGGRDAHSQIGRAGCVLFRLYDQSPLSLSLISTCESVWDAVELNHDRDGQSVPVSVDRAEIVVVVRHGQMEWNVEKIIRGHLDVELNEVGRLQAQAVADRLSKEGKISAIYSSDLKQATETAEFIAIACGEVEVIKDPALQDRNAGILQGLKRIDAANVYPQAYEAYRSCRRDQEIPGGGETKDQLYQRCTTCLRNIGLKHKGERVVVVTHGSVLARLYRQARPNEGRSGAKIKNASVSVFHLFGGDDWVIKSWIDISHLNQTEENLS